MGHNLKIIFNTEKNELVFEGKNEKDSLSLKCFLPTESGRLKWISQEQKIQIIQFMANHIRFVD